MKTYNTNIDQVSLVRTPSDVKKVKITKSTNANNYLRELYNPGTIGYNETFIVLYLNTANNTIAWQLISQGGLNSTVVDVRMVVKGALDCGATSIILSHNHPSGNINPSNADKLTTKKIKDAAKLFDIRTLDHIIVSGDDETYYSFGDNGEI